MASTPPVGIRQALRAALKARMVERDRVAADALRVAIAAVENLEALPLDEVSGRATAVEDAPAAAEVLRRHVPEEEARRAVAAEADDLERAAADYDALGRSEAAARVRHQAAAVAAVVREVELGRHPA